MANNDGLANVPPVHTNGNRSDSSGLDEKIPTGPGLYVSRKNKATLTPSLYHARAPLPPCLR